MSDKKELNRQRYSLLRTITGLLEGPMILLGFVWLVLLILELTGNADEKLIFISTLIWVIFIADFLLKFILAPEKLSFLKKNLLTAVSLLVPALRLFRAMRVLQLLKGTRLIKVIASLNRSMRSLNATMKRRGFGYAMVFTLAVILAGAAGIFAFESKEGILNSYGESVWWTVMVIMTIGTDYWPRTPEGRILCILLAVYGFAVLGYVTATLASFFIGRDAEEKNGPVAGSDELEGLKREIAELKETILSSRNNND